MGFRRLPRVRLFLLTCRIRDYEERWEVYQETLVHALCWLPWLWDRFGPQADISLYLPLCLRTVLARRATWKRRWHTPSAQPCCGT